MIDTARTWAPPSWVRMLPQALMLATTSSLPPLDSRWAGLAAHPTSVRDARARATIRRGTRSIQAHNDIDCQLQQGSRSAPEYSLSVIAERFVALPDGLAETAL